MNISYYTVFKGTDIEFTGNYKQVTEHFEVNYGAFYNSLRRGHTLEEVIDINS